MISVILTTHDGYAKYLKRAIESVLNQTYTDFELLIVNDGKLSADTAAVLKEFTDDCINVLKFPMKFGNHTRPKNYGTQAAKGEYIAYLDADNVYRKDHLQALHKEITKSDVDCVYGDRLVVNELDKKTVPGVKSDFNLGLLAKQNYIDTSDVLVKKEAIEKVGGWDEGLQYFADWNLWVRMAKSGCTFKHVPLVLTDYYYHGKNNVIKARKGMNFDVQGCKIWPDKTLFGERPKLKVAVYTLTYDRLSYTHEMMTTMREKTKYPFDHFVVDNGSQDKTPLWLADKQDWYGLKLWLNEENTGISAASNTALKMILDPLPKTEVKYDIIIKADNDLEFITDGWLEEIVDVFERARGVIVSPYIEGLIDHPGGAPRVRNGYIDKHYVGIVQHLGGACVAAPAQAYKDFRWPDKDFLHGLQDAYFSQEMLKRGYSLLYLENVRVEHCFPTSPNYQETELDTKADSTYRARRKKEKVTKYVP